MKRSLTNTLAEPNADIAVVMLAVLVLAIFGGQLAYNTYFHIASDTWEKVPAKVMRIVNHPKSAMLEYSYSFSGKHFTGDRYEYLSPGTVPEKKEINERFKVGDGMVIRVDPEKPSRSVVQRGSLHLEQFTSHVMVIGFTLVASGTFVFRHRRRRAQKQRTAETAELC